MLADCYGFVQAAELTRLQLTRSLGPTVGRLFNDHNSRPARRAIRRHFDDINLAAYTHEGTCDPEHPDCLKHVRNRKTACLKDRIYRSLGDHG